MSSYFKDATFGVQAGQEQRTYSPRAGVTIIRDANFGLPHVYGVTRSDTIFGAGYVGAEDRLFFMDVLRHSGRGQLSGFAGGSNKAMDAQVWGIAPYTEADLQEQIDKADDLYGTEGAQLGQDLNDYVAGINQYISRGPHRPDQDAGRVLRDRQGARGLAADGRDRDRIAGRRDLRQGRRQRGPERARAAGRQEPLRRRVRRAGVARLPPPGRPGGADHRPERHPFDYPTQRGTSGVALPDEGTVVDPPNNGSGLLGTGTLGGLLGGFTGLGGASNALLVSGAESESGRPVAVMGPQVAYFMPQILLEQDLHGPDIDAIGASFPGVSPYVLLGHGQDFAWSATSAGQDIIDTFAEKLCEPDGSAPTVQSTNYLYKGDCRPMEILTRVNEITPNPGDPSPPESFTLEAQRTVHGIVYKRGRVDGDPVAFVRQRSTYFHEADAARAFADLNRPSKVQNVQDFQRVVSKINFTFNWFYSDNRDIGYFNSGDNPVRAPGADPDLPNWGTGEYDWQGWETTFKTAQYTPFEEHPQVVNQSYITSWNNKQAPGYDAADDNYAYGPVHRSQSLDEQVQQRIGGAAKMNLPELIDSMEVAGSVDLRATQVLQLMLDVVGTPSDPQQLAAVQTLQSWIDSGGLRRDPDGDGVYAHSDAIKILDSWWPRALEAEFKAEMGDGFFDAVKAMMHFDNDPHGDGDHLGSAYIDGWYGFVSKDLRRVLGQSAQEPFSRTYCGARLADRLPRRAAGLVERRARRAGRADLRRGSAPRRRPTAWPSARRASPTSGAGTRSGSVPWARSPPARSTGSTGPPSSRPSRWSATARAATRGRRRRPRCRCRSCRPTGPARSPDRQHAPPLELRLVQLAAVALGLPDPGHGRLERPGDQLDRQPALHRLPGQPRHDDG